MSRQSELAQLGRVFDNSALSNRNVLINGNFDVWQRGTSGSSTVFFVADRWKNFGIGSSNSVSQQTFIVGQTDVPDEPQFFHRSVVTSSAGVGNLALTQQRIEDVRTFAGKTVTLSFWAKADSSKNIAVEFSQVFGAGGSAGVYGIGVQTCNLTSAWQKFTVTASLPSVSGKTIAASSSLDLDFWMDAGSDYNSRTNSLGQQSGTFDIAQVQLELGDTATPFEHRSYGQELALCQRYCQISLSTSGKGNSSGTLGAWIVPLSPRMRATPSVTLRSLTYHVDEYWTLARSISGVSYLYGYGEAGNGVGIVAAVPCNAFAQLGLEAGAFMFDAEL